MRPYDSFESLPEAFFAMAREAPDREVYTQARIDGGDDPALPRPRQKRTFGEVRTRIQAIAHFLRQAGVRKGDSVAIISQSRPEWMEADLAILAAGGVSVSVYPSLTAEEIGFILFDSGAKHVFAENQEQLDKLLRLVSQSCPIPQTESRPAQEASLELRTIITFEATRLNGVTVELSKILESAGPFETELFERAQRYDTACLVYTSGTTGPPKGVVQSHGNHLANIRQARESKLFDDESCVAVLLPLAHAFAKLMGYLGFLTPASIEFPAVVDTQSSRLKPESLARDLREGNADIVPTVPRMLEKMQEAILAKTSGGGLSSLLLRLAIDSARATYAARKTSTSLGVSSQLTYALTGSIRRKLKLRLFGPRFRYAISGGAKLQISTNEFFDALGILVLEGYGLTETVVATNVNRPERRRIGTVGPPLGKDIEVQIANDGEILFRGPNVARRYLNRPQATAEAFDAAGWFHTGDLGSLSEDGFLSINGRKKELIVTSGGKKIAPEMLEQKFKKSPLISQFLMFGDDRPYCVALVTLNTEAARAWAKENGVTVTGDLTQDPQVHAAVWHEIELANGDLASFETVKRIRILPEDFTIENGLLTPTMKMKRREIVRRFEAHINSLYEAD